MKRYEVLNVLDRAQLDTIKVGDYFIFNNQQFYRMKVMAVTKDFIVGVTTGKDKSYTLLSKFICEYRGNQTSGTRPTVGPDSFYCLGYDTEEEAQENLNQIQAWWDAEDKDAYALAEHKKHEDSKYYKPGYDFPLYSYHNLVNQDPRSRYTIDLISLKVLRS